MLAYQLEFRALREGFDMAVADGTLDKERYFWTFDNGDTLEYTCVVHYHSACEGYIPAIYFDEVVADGETRESVKDYLERAASKVRDVLIQHAADVAGVD